MCNKLLLMQTRRNNITNLLLFAIIAVAIYLIQRIAAFEVSTLEIPYAGYRDLLYPEYIIVFVALLGLSAWYIYVEKKKGELKLHIPLIIFLSILFLISVISIILFPSRLEVDVPVFIRVFDTPIKSHTELDYIKYGCVIATSVEQKILFIFISFAVLYMVYLTLWVLPRKIRYLRELNMLMYIIIDFAIALMIYSWIVDFSKYIEFFNVLPDPNQGLPGGIDSFVGNRNSFGVALTFATFACLYLHHLNRKWWILLFPVVFAIQTVLIGSKTNALISWLTLFVYFITMMVFRFKRHIKSSIIILSVIFVLIATFVTLFVIHYFNNEFMPNAANSVEKLTYFFFLKAFNPLDQLSGRDRQFEKAIGLLDMGYWGVGIGYGLFNYIFIGLENISNIPDLHTYDASTITTPQTSSVISSDSPHSAFYQIIGTGGIVTIVIYFILVAYLIFAMVKLFKKHKLTVIMCATFLLASLIHGLTEAPTLFFMSPVIIDSLLFTMFVALPILSLYHHEHHPSENRKFLANYEQIDTNFAKYDKSCLVSKSLYFFLTPAVAIVCGISAIRWNPLEASHFGLLIAMIVLLSLFVVAPIVAQLIFDRKTKFSVFLKTVALPYYVVLATYAIFYYLYRLATGPFTLTLSGLLLVATVVSYFSLFFLSKVFYNKAGIVDYLMDLLCNKVYSYQKKYIEVSNEEDTLTLQEKFFRLLTPKRFRKDEARDN